VTTRGIPSRPQAAPNRGVGKELPRDVDPGEPIPEEPANRRQRRADAAWRRKNQQPQPRPRPTQWSTGVDGSAFTEPWSGEQ
jgi:hypothetical protein